MKVTGIMLMLLLLLSPKLAADWWLALNAYEQQDYALAKTEFTRLVPYGNEDAIYNLGVMYYRGEAVTADPKLALAHFILAAELGRPELAELISNLQQDLDAEQLAQVESALQQLRQQVKISAFNSDSQRKAIVLPEPIKRIPPKYPVNAARAGQFGYVAVRFVVDEAGAVHTPEVVDAFPEKVFDREAVRAIKRWQYAPSDKKHLFLVRLDFSIDGGVDISNVEQFIDQHNLWQGALIGSPQHQFILGSLFQLVGLQSGTEQLIDKNAPISDQLDLSVFRAIKPLKAKFDGFVGNALVRVAEDGTIVEQLKADFHPSSAITELVGLTLQGKVETDLYRIIKNADIVGSREPSIAGVFSVPASYSASFWWDKAAKNGNKAAQRIMAAYDARWEAYLLEQQDAEVMAWVGSRLLLEGKRAEGIALLDAAIANQYQPAKTLKKQLL